jgi:large subunit ribosomal protein L22|tara:strand:- start:521 stop:946 length:426 start_codon:yes stop_codon:yes gene_type:complete
MVEKNLNNTAHAIGKSIKSSQQKANLVLRSIRGLPVENAVNILQFSRRRISNIILKILNSAISNAENNHQLDIDKLYVKEATVGKSMVLKRFRPRARGRAGKILKPFSRIKIELIEKKLEEKESKLKKESNQEKVENGTKN